MPLAGGVFKVAVVSKVYLYVVFVIVAAVIANPELEVAIAYNPGVPLGIDLDCSIGAFKYNIKASPNHERTS